MQLGNQIISPSSVYFTLFLVPFTGDMLWALDAKLTELTVQTGCLSYQLILRPALIQKPSAQRPKDFHQHGIVNKRKMS